MSFRAWLRRLLKEGKYRSQYQMADAYRVKQPTVANWLRGAKLPDLESCSHISEAEGIPLADIAEMVRRDARGARGGSH